MEYWDEVYGSVDITEPVLLELIHSGAVQRLRGILQHGITGLIGVTEPITRFEHSVGAMLLVRRLGGSIEEQIGALLHDVSHTAFSHVIDHVFDSAATQSYHDQVKAEYVAGTDIPAILTAFGYAWRDFVDEEQFPLLEQPSPRLCADRIDYFLRDSVPLGLGTRAAVQRALAHLVVHNGRIMLDDLDAARWMADTFMAADDASWANFKEVGLYELTAEAIRRALEVGALDEVDFWQTDEIAWRKLNAHPDGDLRATLALIRPQTQFTWDEHRPTFVVNTKIRTIDPDVVIDGVAQPLSAWDSAFARRRTAYLERKSGHWPMRVVVKGE